eukprot:364376-Chlamydomonas_euryale.AAC.5
MHACRPCRVTGGAMRLPDTRSSTPWCRTRGGGRAATAFAPSGAPSRRPRATAPRTWCRLPRTVPRQAKRVHRAPAPAPDRGGGARGFTRAAKRLAAGGPCSGTLLAFRAVQPAQRGRPRALGLFPCCRSSATTR